eukprot:6736397-Ditylum_brightwellii.AAC.1
MTDTATENTATSETAEENLDHQLDNKICAIFATSPMNEEEEIEYNGYKFLLEYIDIFSCDSNTISYNKTWISGM